MYLFLYITAKLFSGNTVAIMSKINIIQQEHKLTILLQYTQSQDPVLAPEKFGSVPQRELKDLVFFPRLKIQITKELKWLPL